MAYWYPLNELRQVYTEELPMLEVARRVYGRGKIAKVKFPDLPEPPQFSWYFFPTGSCKACRNYHHPWLGWLETEHCLRPEISVEQFHEYSQRSDCPYFAPGMDPGSAPPDEPRFADDRLWWQRQEDAFRAAGLLPGQPTQRVEVLQVVDWTPWRAIQAQNQQNHFGLVAADVADGVKFTSWEEGDPNDDKGPIDTSE